MSHKLCLMMCYLTLFLFISISFSSITQANTNLCVFGDDYWFTEGPLYEHIETFNAWNFTIHKVRDYSLEGVVLSIHNYSKNNASIYPIDIISPVDVFIGVDDIADDYNNYSFNVDRWEHRVIFWSCAEDEEYFRTHVGNNHLIPHNEYAYKCLLRLKEGDIIELSGKLVKLDGERGELDYFWDTDTQIGNNQCETILVDNITVNGIEWGGILSNNNIKPSTNSIVLFSTLACITILVAICAWMYFKKNKYN